MIGHQMALEHREVFAAHQADDVAGPHGLPDGNGRVWLRRFRCFLLYYGGERTEHLLDECG